MPEKSKILLIVFGICAFILVAKTAQLQIFDSKYKEQARRTTLDKTTKYPARGLIYDRNGKLIVANQSSYDVMVTPEDVEQMDTLEFCNLIKITKQDFLKYYHRADNYSPRIPSVFLTQLSKEDYAYLQEKVYKYKGFYIQQRSLRQYPLSTA